jgi:hypothetical protein
MDLQFECPLFKKILWRLHLFQRLFRAPGCCSTATIGLRRSQFANFLYISRNSARFSMVYSNFSGTSTGSDFAGLISE